MAEENKNYNTENDRHERGLLGYVIGGMMFGPVRAVVGDKLQHMVTGDDDDKEEDEEQKPQNKKGGSCSGNSSSDSSSSCNNPIGEQTPEEAPKTPKFKLKIDENDIP